MNVSNNKNNNFLYIYDFKLCKDISRKMVLRLTQSSKPKAIDLVLFLLINSQSMADRCLRWDRLSVRGTIIEIDNL